MTNPNALFKILGLTSKIKVDKFCKSIGIPLSRLKYYNHSSNLPSGTDLEKICEAAKISKPQLMLSMGIIDRNLLSAIQRSADLVYASLNIDLAKDGRKYTKPNKVFETKLGELYRGDCLDLMRELQSDSIDLIFADPPFNLKKLYPSKIDDDLKEEQYLIWCEEWAGECVRLLKPGGSFFIWNLPKWNTSMAEFLNNRLTFRHWISVDIKYSLPISGRLYPSHYALLYYCKGERPAKFHPDRFPMPVCPHCAGDLRDYGGYKSKMNPKGVNMTDVWNDIPPVRHAKYKRRNGANELSIRLLDRIIELASDEGDLVFDPFGGSGTTYAVAEIKKRRWIGSEIGPADDIINRFDKISEDALYIDRIRKDYNCLFTIDMRKRRQENGLWTSESVRKKTNKQMPLKFQAP